MGIKFIYNPTTSTSISSNFGYRFHPVLKKYKGHQGIDIRPLKRGVSGDKLFAVADGKVIISKVNNGGVKCGYGYYCVIQHNGFQTLYGHQKNLSVKVGQSVKAGDVIGYMGNTGTSTNVHLHFGLKNNKGNWIDPKPYLPNVVPKSIPIVSHIKEATELVTFIGRIVTIHEPNKLINELDKNYGTSTWWVIKKLSQKDYTNKKEINGKNDIYRRTLKGITVHDPSKYNNELLKNGKNSSFYVIKKMLDKLGIE